jgi:hypothetical protein
VNEIENEMNEKDNETNEKENEMSVNKMNCMEMKWK